MSVEFCADTVTGCTSRRLARFLPKELQLAANVRKVDPDPLSQCGTDEYTYSLRGSGLHRARVHTLLEL